MVVTNEPKGPSEKSHLGLPKRQQSSAAVPGNVIVHEGR